MAVVTFYPMKDLAVAVIGCISTKILKKKETLHINDQFLDMIESIIILRKLFVTVWSFLSKRKVFLIEYQRTRYIIGNNIESEILMFR